MSPVSYFTVQERLETIMADLVERQPGYEDAAEQLVRRQRDVKKRLASIRLSLRFREGEKDTVQAREDKALTALAAADDGVYEQWVDAEAKHAGARAAIDTLTEAATIGMSLLKAMQREGDGSRGPQPAWSNGARS